MKLLNKAILLSILSISFSLAQDCTAEISIQTNNPSAKIFINNELSGTGTLTKELGKGSYALYVVQDSLTWNPESFRDTFVISECGKNKSFTYTFNDKVYLQTNPADTYVYSGDSLIGHTPLFLAKDYRSLRLVKQGYVEEIISAEQFRGRTIQLRYLGEEKDLPFIERDIFKILVGSAAVLGGITAYFKLKADDYFEEYEFSGKQDLLDKTRSYDLISGFSFAALQINFGVLIYYFLIED